ncbi:class I adenylate-forming enzyme family protein [Amycolatopsis sp. EV170708-02-1]|uniref:class I adenylate-forming enzyme family protein n=1 Tax=Amycolatopsis sp. EV170708-02-1 TaxID=2919322 RepID=UPI001F0C44A1|nr:AMP-binding protein [Amycolatopsis sp. EV170708-02-1]UMP06915.1 AMP-binding protein [Amycolatopsis sp. EV170708-02-1]
MNLAGHLAALARDNGWSDRLAYQADDAAVSYAELYSGSACFAGGLAARGVTAGDRVLLALPDSVEFVQAVLGTIQLGAVAIPVNTFMHETAVRRAAEIALPHVTIAERGTPGLEHVRAVTPGQLGAARPLADHVATDAGSVAFAFFTSGTTGTPRLCYHTHGDPAVYDQAIGQVIGLKPADTTLSASRMYFAYGFGNSLLFPLLHGSSTVLSQERLTESVALNLIDRHQVSVFYGQPSFYARLLQHSSVATLDTLRLALVAGEPLPVSVEVALRKTLGDRLLNIFGTTEVGHALIANTPTAHRETTIGRILPPYRMRVVDKLGEEVAPGAEGALEVRGPTIAPGVARASDTPLRMPDDWYATGDAATVDRDGFVRLHGRLDDIEIVGGQNVHPAEIEDLLVGHSAVHAAGVCSVRRETGVTSLRAHIELAGSAEPSRVIAELAALAREELSWYEMPEDIIIVESLPRTPVGKLDRRALRTLAAG